MAAATSPVDFFNAIGSKTYAFFATTHKHVVNFFANLSLTIYYKVKVLSLLAGQTTHQKTKLTHRFHKAYGDNSWNQMFFNANGIASDHYVPEDLFYVNIEAQFNKDPHMHFVTDKNNLDRLRLPCNFPNTIGRWMSGMFLDHEYRPASPEILASMPQVFIKPSRDSGGGRNISVMSGREAAAFAAQCIKDKSKTEYVFQEPLQQSADLARLSPDAVATMRIVTLNLNGEVSLVASLLRMARLGSKVDNLNAGGVACGIKNGRLIPTAYDKKLKPFTQHPDTGLRFENTPVPSYDDAVALCLKLQQMLPEVALVAWDVMIDKNNQPLIIEINARWQEINFLQVAHGPLFGDRLPEILAHTKPCIVLGCTIA